MSQHPLVRERLPWHRRLHVEPLEDRRLLAAVTVNTILDTVNFNDGLTSLREAIFATNLVGGADTIEFAPSLTSAGPARLTFTQGELAITDSLTINGPGAELLTIDASGNDPTPDVNDGKGSRIFNIDDGNDANLLDASISGLTLTGGDVNDNGGAIFTRENLSVTSSTIAGNSAALGGGIYAEGNVTVTSSIVSRNSVPPGDFGSGGGIWATGIVTVTSSTISGNSASRDCDGGGVFGGSVTVISSTISGNSAGGGGGGILARYGDVTVTSSTISGNSARVGSGGGIWARRAVTVTSSTISGNSAGGGGGGILTLGGAVTITTSTISGNSTDLSGGGILALSGAVTITTSTISGNSTRFESGGGIWANGNLTVTSSTISGNSASRDGGDGGGVFGGSVTVISSTISENSAGGDGGGIRASYYATVAIKNSIVAGNWRTSDPDPPVADDLTGGGVFTLGYSIVGSAVGIINTMPGTINYFGVDPHLGPLADNGGPTFTHALLPGSPALNAGDPIALVGVNGVPLYDQRGAPFARVVGGRIDIGTVESQPIPPAVFGDYNTDGTVDASDYVLWRNTLGDTVTAFSGADGSGNGLVDQPDYQVWRRNFGATLPAPAPAVAAAMQNEAAASPLASDAWFGLFAVERQSRSAASAISTGLAAVPTYASGTVDLLLVLDGVSIDKDTVPLGTVALDAAFSAEDDEVDLSVPPAVALASL